jgi:multicomponent Na+:H+ antiporter subunit E
MVNRVVRFLFVWLMLAWIWWVLAEGVVPSPGLVAVFTGALAAGFALRLDGGLAGMKWSVLLRLMGWFVMQSLQGSWDVAVRAVSKPKSIQPYVMEYECVLPLGGRRSFFLAVIGLLPGTLAVGVAENCVSVHVLDESMAVETGLKSLETLLLNLFGEVG